MADLFWRRWNREYLPLMQERQKWIVLKKNLKQGDMVLIIDDTAPQNAWLMNDELWISFQTRKGLFVEFKSKQRMVLWKDPSLSCVC